MAEYFFTDLRKRFIEINNKFVEYEKMKRALNEEIKEIEDKTNQTIKEHDGQFNEWADEALDKKLAYLNSAYDYAQELIDNIRNSQGYFDRQVSGAASFQKEGRSRANCTKLPYSQDVQENIDLIENLATSIHTKTTECTRDMGLIGLGKKLAGFNNEKYVSTYTLFYLAYDFFDGLKKHFEALYDRECEQVKRDSDSFYENICRQSNAKVDELHIDFDKKRELWRKELETLLDIALPYAYLEEIESIYNRTVQMPDAIPENRVSQYIPVGKISLYVGYLKDWDAFYDMFNRKYGRFFKNDYINSYAVWNISENRNLIFANYKEESWGKSEIESIICKNIRAVPAGEFQFTVCNAAGLIDEYEDLTNFIIKFPQISGGRILTDTKRISEKIEEYVERMDDIIQRQLVGYSSLLEFNEKNPNQKIPYRCLCITGFPANLNERMLELILRLLKQGYKSGIQIILQYDKRYYNSDAGTGWQNCVANIMNMEEDFQEQKNFWRNQLYPCIDMIFQRAAFVKENYSLFDEFGEKYDKEMNKPLELEGLIEKREWFQGFSGDLLKIPIGLNEYGNKQYLEMGDAVANGTSHYAVIAGPTGSGKSTLLHTLITNCLLTYSPDEVELYLMDFKEGTEFKLYRDKRVPHIRCIALDAMQEFGESILNKLWSILETRNEQFMEASRNGVEIKNISDYRKAGYRMPRILVIIDEFQVLFDRDHNKKSADRAASKMSDFISKGRVYGIHFVFATQTMHKILEGSSALSRSTLEEMHIRIGLQCQPKEMDLIFGDRNAKECQKKSSAQKGSAIYLENDIVSQPVGMQVAYARPEVQQKLLAEIERHFAEWKCEPAVVFRGKEECLFPGNLLIQGERGQKRIYLGEPISIDEPVSIIISKKRKCNLLVVGEMQSMLDRIAGLWIWQAAMLNSSYERPSVYLFDGAQMIDEKPLLGKKMMIQSETSINNIDNVFRVIPAVNEVYDIYEKRKNNMVQGIKNAEDEQKIYMVISNYQWIEPMMKLMENRSTAEFDIEQDNSADTALDGLMSMLQESGNKKNVSPSKKLHTLLESGYLCGIQIMLTCSDLTCIKKVTSADLAPFVNRIILKTASSAAYMLIDTDINMKNVRENTVLYSDGVHQPYLFKPYKLEV